MVPHAKRYTPVLSGYNAHSFSRGCKRCVCFPLPFVFVEVGLTVSLLLRCRLKGSTDGAVVSRGLLSLMYGEEVKRADGKTSDSRN